MISWGDVDNLDQQQDNYIQIFGVNWVINRVDGIKVVSNDAELTLSLTM